ncbi:MAG: altronate dehydratase [Pirellulaceae bacterium]|nr:altronate dehydratase [Pirellulaceae bacterium]
MPDSTESPTAILIHPRDTVVVCTRPVAAGLSVGVLGRNIVARQDIPAGHKLAICDHRQGQEIVKFGWPIGQASIPISAGQHVHTHNVSCTHQVDTQASSTELPVNPPVDRQYTFDGYVRPNGRVGTRNYLAIISNVNCSASVARRIARHFEGTALQDFPNVDGVISFRHEGGCAMAWEGSRHRMLSRVLAAMARHPNVGGCLFVGLGCEQGSLDHLQRSENLHQIHLPSSAVSTNAAGSVAAEQSTARLIPMLTIQDLGGTEKTVRYGVDVVRQLLPQLNLARRTTVSASHLMLATECGGSDGYSGISANPVLGAAADLLVGCGGTVILSETPEIYGAEHLLVRRARRQEVADKLLERLEWWKQYCQQYGEQFDNNPSVGNKAGGLTTITEKSLGAVAKGGSSVLEAVYEYAQAVQQSGLVVMDTPGFDPASVTGMVAGGANLVAFTTGRGSCFGFKPVPSFKIASNSQLFQRLSDDMDFDAGPVLHGRDIPQLGRELFEELLAVASGRPTCSERLSLGDEEFVPWLVGPVL